MKEKVLVALQQPQLPRELRELRLSEKALLAVISDWAITFDRPVVNVARLLRRMADGLDAVQAMAEAETDPSVAAERLLREIQNEGGGK